MNDAQEDNQKFLNITNKLTDFAFILIFMIALPGIIGVIAGGVAMLFVEEAFLMGEFSLGTFLAGITFSLPIFYLLFLKTRKKKIWYEIIPMSYNKELGIGSLIIYGPIILSSLVFYLFSLVMHYSSFAFEFQFFILTIMPLESLFFCRFFKLIFPISESAENPEKIPEILIKLNKQSLQKVILKEFVIKVIFDIICLIILPNSILIIILTNVIGSILYFATKELIFKLSKLRTRLSEFKLILNLKIIGFMLIVQSLIQFWICLFQSNLNLGLYIVITALLTIKILYIIFYQSIKLLFRDFQIRVKWYIGFIFNDIITIAINILGIIYILIEGFPHFTLLVILIAFLVENIIERHYHLSYKLLSTLYNVIQLITIYAIISFLIIDIDIYLQILIFSALSISIPIILHEIKAISKKSQIIIQNILYIIIFYEIGIYFAVNTTENNLFITDSLIFNYIFFLSLSSLSSLYRLYFIKIKGSETKFFSQLVLIFLFISFFGIFQLIEGGLIGISTFLVEIFEDNNSAFSLFLPTGLLSSSSEFILGIYQKIGEIALDSTFIIKSTNGIASILNITVSGVLSLVGYNIIIQLHENFKVLSSYVLKFNKIFNRSLFSLLACIGIVVIFQSISGIILCLMFATYFSVYIYDSIYEFREEIQKPLRKSKIEVKRVLLLINAFVSLALFFFIGIEFLGLNFTLSLTIALIALFLYINFIPSIKSILNRTFHEKNVLNLLNACILFLIGIFIIPSINFFLLNYIDPNLELGILNWIFISGIFISFFSILSLKQLSLGNYVKGRIYELSKMLLQFFFWLVASGFIIFNAHKIFDYLLLIISINLLLLSFIFKINSIFNWDNIYREIFLTWKYLMSITWELAFGTLISFLFIMIIPIFEGPIAFIIFTGLWLLGIITYRNIKQYILIHPEKREQIIKLVDFIHLFNLIIAIGVFQTFLNLFSIIPFIIPLSLLLTSILTSIVIHISKIVKKYLPDKITILFDVLLLLTLSTSAIISVHSIFESYLNIQLIFDYSILFSLGVIIIGLATLLLIAYYLEKRKIINTLSWNYINFGIIQLEILASFSFILYSEFEWIINNLNAEWIQRSTPLMYLILGGMILGLYLIYKSFLRIKYLEEHSKLTLLLLIQKNFTRIIGVIAISISPIVFFNFELIGFSIAFFLITFVLIFSFKEFQNIFPNNRKLNIFADIILILNLLSILTLIYSISSYFIGLIITESIILSFITFWIFLYILPILIKYIPTRIKHFINAIFMPIFAIFVNISIYLEFLQFGIDVIQDYTLITILIGLLLIFASILFTINQLKKGKYLKDKLHKNIHFIFNMGIYYDLFAIIVSVLLIYVVTPNNLNIYNILFQTSWPLLGLFIILKIIDIKKFYSEILHLKQILKTQILIFWGISTLGLLIIINYLYAFNPLVITITIFIETFILFYSIKLLDEIVPKLHKFLLIIKEILIYINLISISSVIYFTGNEIFGFIPIFSIFIVLLIVSVLIYLIPVYKTGTIHKFLHEIISILIFSSSILLAISINQIMFLPGTSPIFIYFGLLLIPIIVLFFSIFLFSKNTISKGFARNLYQKNEIILFINIAIIIVLFFNEIGLNDFSFLISSLIITALLVIDYFTISLLTDQKTVILSFFSAFLYNLVGITLTISVPLFETFNNPIFIFILVQLPFLFGIFYFVDWANRKIQSAPDLKEFKRNPRSKLSNTKKNHINESDESSVIGKDNSPSKMGSKFAPTTIMNRFAQFISNKWIIMEVCFIFVTLGLNLYLGINIIFFTEEFEVLQILLICSLIVSVITIYQPHSNKFLIYYIQTLITIGLNFLIYDSTLFIYEIQIFLGIIAAIIINRFATRHLPLNNLIKYIQNFLILGIYFFIVINYDEIPLSWVLLISSILFSVFTHRSYKNLTFNSFKVWAFAYFVYDILNIYLEQTNYALMSIFAACVVGLTWQWVVFLKDSKWSNSIIKSILGYTVTISWIFNYAYLYIIYNEFMGLISPPVMAFLVLLLLFLKKKIIIFQKEKFLDILILGGTFFFSYTLGRYYLFENYYYSEPLALTLAGAICGFLFIFILEFLDAKIRKELSLAFFTCASLLAGVFTFLILMEPVIFTETAWEIALPIGFDIALLMFYVGIGIYKRSFAKIWSVGVYAWILVPIINFIMISRLIQGIDNVSSGLTVLNISVNGSIILSIIVCTLMYLPIILTRLLENLSKIIYIFWLELLLFTTWGAVNLFPQSILLQIPFVFLIGLILFVPIFYYYKHWASLSLIWPLIAATNIVFVINFIDLPDWEIPIGTLIGGFYILALGYFPNIKKSKFVSPLIIVLGYFTILASIFWLLYTFVFIIFGDIIISANITFIVISFVLLTGKYFNLRDYLIKIGHSLIVIINLAILLARTFYLIGEHEFTTFGIFLAIAFAFGTTLSFQARKYLPKILFELIWFGMAIFFGLSLFELGLTIFNIGGWASTGVLVIVATLIYFPIIRSYLGPVFILLIGGISMIIMEVLIPTSLFISSNQPLLFLDILISLELAYIYFSSKSKLGLIKNKTVNFEISSIIWVILSALFSTTIILIINMYFPQEIYSNILIFLNTFALQNLLTTYFIRRNELFNRFRIIQKIIPVFHFLLIFTIYLTTSIFCAIKIPIDTLIETSEQYVAIETLYRLAILFLILFIEFYGIDRKIVKLVSSKIRNQLDWISFFIFSACLTVGLYLSVSIWEFSLFIWCLLFFGTIYLNQKAGNKIFPEVLKIVNVLLINVALFSYFWNVFGISNRISNFEFDLLLLNIAINLIIVFLFMKFKIINRRAIKVIFLVLTIIIALYCEEISRIYLIKHFVLNVAVFLFVFAVLNTFNIKHAMIIYIYWTLLVFSFSTFMMEFIPFLYNMSTINYIITFSFICGLQISLIFYLFANQQKDNNLENTEKNIKTSIIHPIWVSSAIVHKIFVIWMIFETFIVSISIAQFWNYIFTDLLLSNIDFTGVEKFFLWISIIPIILSFIFYHINSYMQKNEVWKDKNYIIIGKPELGIVFKLLSVIFLNISLFYHLWYVLDIYSSLKIAEFGSILLNFSINLFILYIFIRKILISRKWQFFISIALSLAISGMIEEYLRVFSNISPLMSVAIFLSILCILNTNKINLTFLVYSYWTIISFCLTIYLYSFSYWFVGGIESTITSIIWFSFIFGAFNTIIYNLLANRSLVKLEIFHKYNPYLKIMENSDDGFKSIDYVEDQNNKPISKDKSRTKSKSAFLLLFGHHDQKQAKQIYAIWSFIEILILSISIAHAWSFLYNNGILFNVISSDNFIQYLIKSVLIILLITIGLVKIFQYIKSNNLWVENEKIKRVLDIARNINGICLYISLPITITSYLHYTLVAFGAEYLVIALFDIISFTILAFTCIYLFDLKKAKIIKEKLAISLTIGIIILFIADISALWCYYTELYPIGIVIFVCIPYIFKILKLIKEGILEKLLFISNSIISIAIMVQIDIFLFKTFDWMIALGISIVVLQIFIELEIRLKLLSPIEKIIKFLRKMSWFLLSVCVSSLILFYSFEDFTIIRLIIGILIFTLMMFYENYLLFREDNKKYFKIRDILGIICYIEIISLLSAILIPLNLAVEITETKPVIFIRLLLITELFVIAFILNLLDKKKLNFIPDKVRKPVDLTLFLSTIVLGAVDLTYFAVLNINLSPSTPSTPSTPGIPLEDIMIPILIISIIIGIVLFIKFKNRKINQIIYLVLFIEIFIYILGINQPLVLIPTIIIALLLYPFIFFLEKMILLLKLIGKMIIDLLIKIKNFFIILWKKIVSLYYKHKRIVFSVLGLILGIVSFVILSNLALEQISLLNNVFISGLIFLIVYYPVSPEKEEDTKPRNFASKILYRTLILICLVGSASALIPPIPWIYTLFLLAFFGYIIWTVRRSEELYNLPIYWRFMSSLGAILDFIITAILLLFYFEII